MGLLESNEIIYTKSKTYIVIFLILINVKHYDAEDFIATPYYIEVEKKSNLDFVVKS